MDDQVRNQKASIFKTAALIRGIRSESRPLVVMNQSNGCIFVRRQFDNIYLSTHKERKEAAGGMKENRRRDCHRSGRNCIRNYLKERS